MNKFYPSKLFFLVSFVIFITSYILLNAKYSKLIAAIYLVFIAFQIFLFFKKIVSTKLRWQLSLLFIALIILDFFVSKKNLSDIITIFSLSSLIIFIGYLAHYIPYNPFIGIRIFSTRYNSDNWKSTHNLLAKLSAPTALLILLLSNFFNPDIVIPGFIVIWVTIPIFYSVWIYFKGGI